MRFILRVLLLILLGVWTSSAQVLVFPITGGSAGAGQATNAIGSANGKGTNASLYGTTTLVGPVIVSSDATFSGGNPIDFTSLTLSEDLLVSGNADFPGAASAGSLDVARYFSVLKFRDYGVTNLPPGTNFIIDLDGPLFARLAVTNTATVSLTNSANLSPGHATSRTRTMTLQIAMPSPGYTVYFQNIGPVRIDWRDGLGPGLGIGMTNYVDITWDGTNLHGFARQEVIAGTGSPVHSNSPTIYQPRFLGGAGVSNSVWVKTNNTTMEGEWRDRPRTGVYRDYVVGAAAFVTNLTDGALLKQEETVANLKNRFYLEFTNTAIQGATFSLPMPGAWDRSADIQIKIYWSSTNALVNRAVRWAVATDHTDDDDPVDQPFGTAVEVTDTISAYNDLMVTTALAPTPGHSAGAANALLDISLQRLPDHADDNTEGVAKVYAVVIRYKESETEPISPTW